MILQKPDSIFHGAGKYNRLQCYITNVTFDLIKSQTSNKNNPTTYQQQKILNLKKIKFYLTMCVLFKGHL